MPIPPAINSIKLLSTGPYSVGSTLSVEIDFSPGNTYNDSIVNSASIRLLQNNQPCNYGPSGFFAHTLPLTQFNPNEREGISPNYSYLDSSKVIVTGVIPGECAAGQYQIDAWINDAVTSTHKTSDFTISVGSARIFNTSAVDIIDVTNIPATISIPATTQSEDPTFPLPTLTKNGHNIFWIVGYRDPCYIKQDFSTISQQSLVIDSQNALALASAGSTPKCTLSEAVDSNENFKDVINFDPNAQTSATSAAYVIDTSLLRTAQVVSACQIRRNQNSNSNISTQLVNNLSQYSVKLNTLAKSNSAYGGMVQSLLGQLPALPQNKLDASSCTGDDSSNRQTENNIAQQWVSVMNPVNAWIRKANGYLVNPIGSLKQYLKGKQQVCVNTSLQIKLIGMGQKCPKGFK